MVEAQHLNVQGFWEIQLLAKSLLTTLPIFQFDLGTFGQPLCLFKSHNYVGIISQAVCSRTLPRRQCFIKNNNSSAKETALVFQIK